MRSGAKPFASSAWITPMWAKPRAAPPPSAKPMRGRLGGGGGTIGIGTAGATTTGGVAAASGADGTGTAVGVLAQPLRPSANSEPAPAASASSASRRPPSGCPPSCRLPCVTTRSSFAYSARGYRSDDCMVHAVTCLHRQFIDVPLQRIRPLLRSPAGRTVPRSAATPSFGRARRRGVPAPAPAERLVRAAPCADVASRRAVRRVEQHAAPCAGPRRPRVRRQGRRSLRRPWRRLRPLLDAAERAVQLDRARRRGHCDGPARRCRHARHPDERQLHPQHHERLLRRHRARRRRRPAAVLRDPAPVEHAAPGVRLPATQVQDRRERRCRRPRPRRRGTTSACICGETTPARSASRCAWAAAWAARPSSAR